MSKTPEEKAKHAAYMRKYYYANKEKWLAGAKRYREENKGAVSERKKKYFQSDAGKAMSKRSYEKNREKIIAYQKKRRLENPEKIKEQEKRKYEKHKEKILARVKKYAQENPEVKRRASAKFMSLNKDRYNAWGAKYRAVKKNAIPKWADLDAISEAYKEAEYHGLHVDHIIPLQSKYVCGLHVWDNLQLLTESKNKAKGNRYWPDMP